MNLLMDHPANLPHINQSPAIPGIPAALLGVHQVAAQQQSRLGRELSPWERIQADLSVIQLRFVEQSDSNPPMAECRGMD